MYAVGLLVFGAAAVFAVSTNPIYGVLTLVLVGLGFAFALLSHGLEFTSFVVVLVYVGAVTVLFIFVVMMVNLRATQNSFTPAGVVGVWSTLVGAILLTGSPYLGVIPVISKGVTLGTQTNLVELGGLLYGTDRVGVTLYLGLVLFVAMVAAICLSLVLAENYRTQEFYTQIRRNNALFMFIGPTSGVPS